MFINISNNSWSGVNNNDELWFYDEAKNSKRPKKCNILTRWVREGSLPLTAWV